MKIDISKRAVSAALALVFVAAAIPSANAQQTDLRTYVVGTWRQTVPSMIGTPEVHVLTLRADGSYIKYIYVNGGSDPAWLAGNWEIQNGNELWMHISAGYPTWTRSVPGPGTIIHGPYEGRPYQRTGHRQPNTDTEILPIQIVDANHTRNAGGIATRIGY